MSKMLKALGMVILAASTAAAPCAPALAYAPGCQMPPCEEGSSAGFVGSLDCCCAASGTASESAPGSASLLSAARGIPSGPQTPETPDATDGRLAEGATLAPASSFYIQHHSLLM